MQAVMKQEQSILAKRNKEKNILKKHLLCLNVLIIAAVILTADGHTDAAAPQRNSITVWFNAGLGNALQTMELNIEDFHKDKP